MDFCCQSWWQSRLCNKYTIHSLNRCSLSFVYLSTFRLSFFLILSLSFTHILTFSLTRSLSFSFSLVLSSSFILYVLFFFYFYFSPLNCVDSNRVIIGLLKNSSCRLFTLFLAFVSFLLFSLSVHLSHSHFHSLFLSRSLSFYSFSRHQIVMYQNKLNILFTSSLNSVKIFHTFRWRQYNSKSLIIIIQYRSLL